MRSIIRFRAPRQCSLRGGPRCLSRDRLHRRTGVERLSMMGLLYPRGTDGVMDGGAMSAREKP